MPWAKACDLEVDGGIEPHTAPLVDRGGAHVLVAGSAVFGAAGGPAAGMAQAQGGCGNSGVIQNSASIRRAPGNAGP